MDPNTEIQFEFPTLIRVYKSGRVERLMGAETTPASFDPTTKVTSKDITINKETNISARLYLPNPQVTTKLPILIYFHGGAFCIQSAFSPTYTTFLNTLASKANMLVVSVNYRLAPEHPLPAAYIDSWESFKWATSASDEWLAMHGDCGRVFLAGDSAGANIAHHIAMQAGKEGVNVDGLVLIHPYFWGKEPVGSESRELSVRKIVEALWNFACPSSAGLDDPMLNPIGEGAPSLEGLGCERVMVCVAEKDILKERGRAYCERLKESGWKGKVEFVEAEGEEHVFHLMKPECEKALEMMERVVAFFS